VKTSLTETFHLGLTVVFFYKLRNQISFFFAFSSNNKERIDLEIVQVGPHDKRVRPSGNYLIKKNFFLNATVKNAVNFKFQVFLTRVILFLSSRFWCQQTLKFRGYAFLFHPFFSAGIAFCFIRFSPRRLFHVFSSWYANVKREHTCVLLCVAVFNSALVLCVQFPSASGKRPSVWSTPLDIFSTGPLFDTSRNNRVCESF
jgi:hypothetical protein